MGASFLALSKQESKFDNFIENITIGIVQIENDRDLDLLYKLNIENLTKFTADFNKINENDEIINDLKFKWIIFTSKFQELNLKQIQYVTLVNKKYYIITFSSTVKKFNQYYPVFMEIMKSFQIQ